MWWCDHSLVQTIESFCIVSLREILLLIHSLFGLILKQIMTMKLTLSLMLIFFSIPVFSQRPGVKPPVKENVNYHELRVKLTVPPYGLVKIKALIQKIKTNDEDETAGLDKNTYESLSLREKFTYTMIHAESYSQNCDAMPPIKNEDKKIFAYIPDAFDEHSWSERQTTFLSSNRDSVIAIMRESIGRSRRVGVNYKKAIIEINAMEMIPDLIAVFNEATSYKDLDLLTVMMQLMKDNEYEPFLLSPSYKKMYAEDASYQSYLVYNKANADLIIKRATEFYNAEKK
jgi:hypothetical protein